MTITHTDLRAAVGKLMDETLSDESQYGDWTYIEARPIDPPSRPWRKGMRVRGDCGLGGRFLWWWAKGPDPMGRGFDGFGNSSSIAANCEHYYEPGEMQVGDPCTVGWNGDLHAAFVKEPGSDPLMWSFGHQGAPNTYRLSWDNRWPKQYCKMKLPNYVPTADDKLRAKTGYWAWVQWTLGEGAWGHKLPKDKIVRPSVPRVINPVWWVMLKVFLKDRHKGNKSLASTPR